MDLAKLVLMLLGLGALVIGAELLVRSARWLAGAAGVSPLLVGLTIVAFGTNAAELAVAVRSGLSGRAELSLGDVVGSNIFNVLAVLGVAAVVSPREIEVSPAALHVSFPVMLRRRWRVCRFSSRGGGLCGGRGRYFSSVTPGMSFTCC